MHNILNLKRDFTLEHDQTGEIFFGKFSVPSVDMDIDIAVAKRLQGASLDSLPSSSYGYIIACKTLDFVIVEKPKNFQWKYFEEIPDYDYVVSLYEKYNKMKMEFLESGKKNTNRTSNNSESRTNLRPVSDAEIQYPTNRNPEPPEPISVPENVHHRGNVDTREFRDLPFENQTVQQTERDNGYRSENVHSRGDQNFPGGSGRVHRERN